MVADPETPAVFVNPEDPDGPTVRPVHCPTHHRLLMARRDENEASFDRIVGRRSGSLQGRW
jgi:hypothetical protein